MVRFPGSARLEDPLVGTTPADPSPGSRAALRTSSFVVTSFPVDVQSTVGVAASKKNRQELLVRSNRPARFTCVLAFIGDAVCVRDLQLVTRVDWHDVWIPGALPVLLRRVVRGCSWLVRRSVHRVRRSWRRGRRATRPLVAGEGSRRRFVRPPVLRLLPAPPRSRDH